VAAARRRLLEAVEPSISRLLGYIESPPGLCPVCNRSDDTAAIVSAARTVLDRAGLHPSLNVELSPGGIPATGFEDYTDDQVVEHLEMMLEEAREIRDTNWARREAQVVEQMAEERRQLPAADDWHISPDDDKNGLTPSEHTTY
jgi:hypothetical protein